MLLILNLNDLSCDLKDVTDLTLTYKKDGVELLRSLEPSEVCEPVKDADQSLVVRLDQVCAIGAVTTFNRGYPPGEDAALNIYLAVRSEPVVIRRTSPQVGVARDELLILRRRLIESWRTVTPSVTLF